MKKLIGGALFLSVSAVASLPTGHFFGSGHWQNSECRNGTYSSYVDIAGDTVNIDFSWHGLASPAEVTFVSDGLDSFHVFYDGADVGEGYCMENQCSYSVDIDGTHYREFIYFAIDSNHEPYVLRKGEKDDGTVSTTWIAEFYRQAF